MWLATKIPTSLKDGKEDVLDRLLALSPEVSEGPIDSLFIPLNRVAGYWKLHQLRLPGVYNSPEAHPFIEQLAQFEKLFGLRFCLTPTAPWALWILQNSPPKNLLETWNAEIFRGTFSQQPIVQSSCLIPDEIQKSETQSAFEFFVEQCDELGLSTIQKLLEVPPEELALRFGAWTLKLLKRIHGRDDLPFTPYAPPLLLSRKFYPAFEKSIGSTEQSNDLLESFLTTLQNWEDRLQARKQLLKGLRLRVRSERLQKQDVIFLSFPRPTRDALSIFPILKEKWFALCSRPQNDSNTEGFHDDIDELILESLGLETDSPAQRDLFDPQKEERGEAWNSLVGRLLAQSTKQNPLQIGYWKPVESYIPESSYEWADWQMDERAVIPMIPDHPRRPSFLLSRPQPLNNPFWRSEEEFLQALAKHQLLSTLEKLSEGWGTQNQIERSYARWNRAWVFWDHQKKRAFVHGFFEDADADFLRPTP